MGRRKIVEMHMLIDTLGLLAQTDADMPGNLEVLVQHLLAAIVFSVVGVIVFFASLWLMEKLTPFSIIHEIGEEQNMAVALIVGMMVLGIAVIVGAAILG